MNVVTAAGLDPAYRLYQLDDGDHVRVKVSVLDADKGAYNLVAQMADAQGVATGPDTSPLSLTLSLEETDVSVVAATKGQAQKGKMAKQGGRLHESDGTDWIDRGPIPDGASDAVIETLCQFDRAARRMAIRAARAWARQSAQPDVNTLIGATP